MTFQYRGYANDGAPRRGLVEATDETDASRRLLAEGVYVRSLAPLAAGARPQGGFNRAPGQGGFNRSQNAPRPAAAPAPKKPEGGNE